MVFAVVPFAIGGAGVLVAASLFGYSVRARPSDVLQRSRPGLRLPLAKGLEYGESKRLKMIFSDPTASRRRHWQGRRRGGTSGAGCKRMCRLPLAASDVGPVVLCCNGRLSISTVPPS